MRDTIFLYFSDREVSNRGLNQLLLRHCNQGNFGGLLPSADLLPRLPRALHVIVLALILMLDEVKVLHLTRYYPS